jgi:prepilin-type N-terminal cleavage/methylation domain-containing protein
MEQRMRVRAGFTLMEVLAVMLIFGVLAATAMPRFNSGLMESRLQRAATVVSADLRLAHSLAERQRAPVTVLVDVGSKVLRVVDTRTPEKVYSERHFAGQRSFGVTGMTTSTASVVVYPNGLASGDLVIKLQAPGGARTVKMTRAGVVRVIS